MRSIALFAFLIGCSCTQEPVVSLNSKDRKLIDSLFIRHIDSIKPYYDTFCIHFSRQNLDRIVDSLYQQRLIEIEAQLQRLQQSQDYFE